MQQEFKVGDTIQHIKIRGQFKVMSLIPSGDRILLQVGDGEIAKYNFWANECTFVGERAPKSLMTW